MILKNPDYKGDLVDHGKGLMGSTVSLDSPVLFSQNIRNEKKNLGEK